MLMDTNYGDDVKAFRLLPGIDGELPFIIVNTKSIIMIDALKNKGVKYLVAISSKELEEDIESLKNSRVST